MKDFIETPIQDILGCPYCNAMVNVNKLRLRSSSSPNCHLVANCPEKNCKKAACLSRAPRVKGPANTPSMNPDKK
jgi:hypothetical protein